MGRSLSILLLVGAAFLSFSQTRSEACCTFIESRRAPDLRQLTPRNVLARIAAEAEAQQIEVRRLSPPVTGRVRVTAGDLLDLGATYEVWLDGVKWQDVTIDAEADHEPPAFAGATRVHYGLHDYFRIPFRSSRPHELVIEHPLLPLDTDAIEVTIREAGASHAWRRRAAPPDRRRTVLASVGCGSFEDLPRFEPDANICVSLTARDAAGNESGGDVEVCTPVVSCPPLVGLFVRRCELLDPDWHPEPPRPFIDELPQLRELPPRRWPRNASLSALVALAATIAVVTLRRRWRTWI